MFSCSYKFELEDCITGAKYIYKSQKRKQDKIIAILIPFLMAGMIALLVADILMKRQIVWDAILLVALVVLEAIYLLIPVMLLISQKAYFKKTHLSEMDAINISINDNVCAVNFTKDGQEVSKQILSLKALTSYIEDNYRIVLVFNKVEYVCIRKQNLVGGVEQLKTYLNKAMSKAVNKKA